MGFSSFLQNNTLLPNTDRLRYHMQPFRRLSLVFWDSKNRNGDVSMEKDPAKAESFIMRLRALIKFNPWRHYGCTVGSVFEVSSRIFASKTTKALPLFRPCGSDDRSSVNQKTVP